MAVVWLVVLVSIRKAACATIITMTPKSTKNVAGACSWKCCKFVVESKVGLRILAGIARNVYALFVGTNVPSPRESTAQRDSSSPPRRRGWDYTVRAKQKFRCAARNRTLGSEREAIDCRTNKTRSQKVKNRNTGQPKINAETRLAETTEVSNRRAGYDFTFSVPNTFSVPKSVSLYLAAVNDDKMLERMVAEALEETMRAIEQRIPKLSGSFELQCGNSRRRT